MNKSCPINFVKVDFIPLRVLTLYLFLLAAGYFLSGHISLIALGLILLLSLGFYPLQDNCIYKKHKQLCKLLHLREDFHDSASKVFAFRFGSFIFALMIISHFLNLDIMNTILNVNIMIVTFLEVTIDFCFGCWLYSLKNKLPAIPGRT